MSFSMEVLDTETIKKEIIEEVKPVYKEFKGWKADLSNCLTYEELPVEFKQYVDYIEKETGVPVSIIFL